MVAVKLDFQWPRGKRPLALCFADFEGKPGWLVASFSCNFSWASSMCFKCRSVFNASEPLLLLDKEDDRNNLTVQGGCKQNTGKKGARAVEEGTNTVFAETVVEEV